MTASETIYTAESFRWTIPAVQQNGLAVTNAANIPDSFTYEGRSLDNAALSPTISGNMTYLAGSTSSWYADIIAPTAAGGIHLHATVTKTTSVGFFHDFIEVASRQ